MCVKLIVLLMSASSEKSAAGPTQKQLLAKLGRRKYVSISALSEVLEEIRQHGMPDNSSRSSIKRARDEYRMVDTRYGPIFRTMPITLNNRTQPFNMMYLHPGAMLTHLAQTCKAFSEVFQSRIRLKPSSPSEPWHVLVYCDEITPGDPLKRENRKKIWALYWSFQEFGPISVQ